MFGSAQEGSNLADCLLHWVEVWRVRGAGTSVHSPGLQWGDLPGRSYGRSDCPRLPSVPVGSSALVPAQRSSRTRPDRRRPPRPVTALLRIGFARAQALFYRPPEFTQLTGHLLQAHPLPGSRAPVAAALLQRCVQMRPNLCPQGIIGIRPEPRGGAW